MYYLFRDNGSIALLHGSLVNGIICTKAGSFFNRKWVPFLSDRRLQELGLLEEARTLIESGNDSALAADSCIVSCAYRLGSNPEGTILDEEGFSRFLAGWIRESDVGKEIGLNPLRQPQGALAVAISMRLGMFVDWAKEYLEEIGPEISPQAFQDAMRRALQRAGLIP